MAAAGNLAAGGHNASAAAAGVLPMAAVPGVLPGGLLGAAGGLPGVVSGGLPTAFVVVNGMINAATLADDEEYEEVRHTLATHFGCNVIGKALFAVLLCVQHRAGVCCRWHHLTRGRGEFAASRYGRVWH